MDDLAGPLAVAGSCGQRYPGRVRCHTSQRALIALLLIVRLFFGGAVEAMPHTFADPDGAHQLSATGVSGMDCPSHHPTSGNDSESASLDGDAHHHSLPSGEGDHDCCKSGSCECPCTHVSAYVVALTTPPTGFPSRLTVIDCVVGPPCDRPNLLFRPPA